MNDFFTQTYYGNTIGRWFVALLIAAAAVVVGKIVYWIIKNVIHKLTSKTKTKLDDIIVDMIEEPIMFAIIIAGVWWGLSTLTFGENAETWVGHIYYILIMLNVAWLITRLFDSLVRLYVVPIVEKSKSELDDQVLPIIRKSLKLVVWIVAIIVGLNNAGIQVAPLLAGLGIGGLVFALAAQDSVANLFGGLTIFVDKPFKLRDRIKINGFDGTIKEVGVRSTRLVTLEGRTVTLPNKVFTGGAVENVSSEPTRKVVLNLGLTYDMDDKKIEKAMEILKEIAANNDNIEDNTPMGFNQFGDFALNILFIYYIKKSADILGTQTEINLEILKQFNKSKLEFAFPSQTIFTKQI